MEDDQFIDEAAGADALASDGSIVTIRGSGRTTARVWPACTAAPPES